jgi:hypothetical protein
MKSIAPTFNLHKFRHVLATKLASKKLFDECELKPGKVTNKEVENYYMDVMTQVGQELGHRNKDKVSPSMAIGAYVSKSLSNKYFDKYNISPSQKLSAVLNKVEASSTIRVVSSSYTIKIRKKI